MNVCEFAKAELKKYSEPGYKKFSSSLIPGVENILGVRLPLLRKIAKEIAKSDWEEFISAGSEEYMEDTMLSGLVLSYVKEDFDRMLELTADFVPKINNWAVCDCVCNGLKFVNKDKRRAFNFLLPYLASREEYKLRFGVVMLLSHFIEEDFIDEILKILFNLKFPEKTYPYLKKNKLQDFIHNKAVSKIIESYRVSKEEKEKLRKLRRK